jgi:hypothetical protein
MTFRSVYSEEHGGFRPQRAPPMYPKHMSKNITQYSIYKQNNVLPSHVSALDRRQCARVHVIAPNSHGIGNEAMAAKATRDLRADEACARLPPLG